MKNNSSKREHGSNNLIRNIKIFFNDCSVIIGEKRAEILFRYFGINSNNYMCKEIGSYYGISRERIRQIKEATLNELMNIFLGKKNEKGNFICSLDLIKQINDFRILLHTHSVISQDRLYTGLSPNHENQILSEDKPYINLLLAVFGFDSFGYLNNQIYYDKRKFNKQSLCDLLKTIQKTLNKNIYPLDVLTLIDKVKKELNDHKLENNDIENILEEINEFESISENGKKCFQFRFDVLSTIGAMGARILYENKQSMRLIDVTRDINKKLKQLNLDRTITVGSVRSEFVDSSFTKASGKSGYWTLKEWGLGYRSISSLIESALISANKPLSFDEIYKGITNMHSGIKKETSCRVISMNKKKFLRLDDKKYILKEWGDKYNNQLYTKKFYNDIEIMKQIIKIYTANAVRSLNSTSLRRELEKAGIGFPDKTYNTKILQYPILERSASYSREILLKDDYEIALSKINLKNKQT